jgi:hypothetical protein
MNTLKKFNTIKEVFFGGGKLKERKYNRFSRRYRNIYDLQEPSMPSPGKESRHGPVQRAI